MQLQWYEQGWKVDQQTDKQNSLVPFQQELICIRNWFLNSFHHMCKEKEYLLCPAAVFVLLFAAAGILSGWKFKILKSG